MKFPLHSKKAICNMQTCSFLEFCLKLPGDETEFLPAWNSAHGVDQVLDILFLAEHSNLPVVPPAVSNINC